MPDSCGTPTREITAHNLKTGEEIRVMVVVGDEHAEIGDYSFDLAQLRRVLGSEPSSEGKRTFHPGTGQADNATGPEDAPADHQLIEDEAFKYREWGSHLKLDWDKDRTRIFDLAEARLCQCWNEGQYGRVHREDCPIHWDKK